MSLNKNLAELITGLAADAAAGFAQELSDSLRRSGAAPHHHPNARRIGRDAAAGLFGTDPEPLVGELVDDDPPTEREILDRRLAVWGHNFHVTPELLAAYQRLETRRIL